MEVPARARRFLAPIAERAERLRLPCFVVGGCVRDWLLGRPTFDIDLVCEGDAAPLAEFCARALRAHAEPFGRFGTWRVIDDGKFRVDLAAARAESYPRPAALPEVRPAGLAEDLRRRDFTVNAMALPLPDAASPRPDPARVIDPYGGRQDLREGRLRALHGESLRDDPTRAFRAARYAARFGLRLDPELLRQIHSALENGHARRLSAHRLLQELWRLLAEEEPAPALRRLKEWGYLSLLHPRLAPPPKAARRPEERLGAMALALGPAEGEEFLRSLPLEHGLAGELHAALAAARERRAQRTPLTPLGARVLRLSLPQLPPAALKPAFLRGEDLLASGLKPSPEFSALLNEASRLQWEGRLPARRQALAWLRRRAAASPRA